MEVKLTKNLGYEEKKKKGTKKNNYPIVSRKSFTEEVAEANCYSKEDKVYTRNNLCPPEKGWTKITLKKTSHPLGFSEFLKGDFF